MLKAKQIHFEASAESCALWVKSKTPWYAPRFLIRNKIRAATAEYRGLPGLLMKYFTINDDGTFGGLYFWKDAGSRDAFYTQERVAEITRKRGAEPKVTRLRLRQTWIRAYPVQGYEEHQDFWQGRWQLSFNEGTLNQSTYARLQKLAGVVGIFTLEEERNGKAFHAFLFDDKAQLEEPIHSEVPVIIVPMNDKKTDADSR
ncbi:MAG: hypothetical protein KGP28_01640 [Bdellovibrionales bacterium]|nr:hypothetical protein [Bdellovibrionales bacterium]